MRISYISSSNFSSRAANCVNVIKMANAFAELGHHVTLFGRADARDNPRQIFEKYDVTGRFRLELMEDALLRVGRLKGGYAARGVLASIGKTELVVTRNALTALYAALFGMPVVLEAHIPIPPQGTFGAFAFRQLINSQNFRGLVVITHELRRLFEQNFPDLEGRVLVAADGADPVSADLVPATLRGDQAGFHVGYAGHLYPGKGMEVLAGLAPLCAWAQFHVLGGIERDIVAWQQTLAGLPNVSFLGYQPHRSVAKYLAAFDAVLLPNQTVVRSYPGDNPEAAKRLPADIGRWTSPLKLFEYMAAGKAIVASDLPVLREILTDGVNALLCPPTDASAWSAALLRLRDDPPLRARLGARARSDLLDGYTWSHRAGRILDFVSNGGLAAKQRSPSAVAALTHASGT